eukprot:c35257_g1_i1 orf=209-481(+)
MKSDQGNSINQIHPIDCNIASPSYWHTYVCPICRIVNANSKKLKTEHKGKDENLHRCDIILMYVASLQSGQRLVEARHHFKFSPFLFLKD